jgi:hypothetical protein
MGRVCLLLNLTVALTGAAVAGDLRIKVPEGMKAISRQEGDTLEISFVPITESQEPKPTQLDVDANGAALPSSPFGSRTTIALLSAETAPSSSSQTTTAAPDASPAPAANSPTDQALTKAVTALNFDRPLSAAPAFVALGVTPETVSHPATPREFAASLLNGVDRKGTLQTGFALEAAPYQVFFGPQTTLRNYQESYFTRLLYNINVSLATTKASTNDDKAQRVAFGMELTLFDKGDPRMDKRVRALFDEVTSTSELPVFDPDDMSIGEYNALVKAQYEKFDPNKAYIEGLEKIRAKSWGKTAWNVAWAPTWVSTSGNAGDLKYEGLTAWSTFAYGFENVDALKGRAQFIAHLRYRDGEQVLDPNNSTLQFKQNTLFAAARLRWGRPDLSFSAEGAYIRIWDGPHGDDQAYRLGAILEKKVASNLWFVLSVGEDFGVSGQANELFTLGSLRFGSADSPTFAAP